MFKSKKSLLFILFSLVIVGWIVAKVSSWGRVDQDYYSQYYIGQGVLSGKLIYADFTDNKGPIVYLVFSVMVWLFGNRLEIAFIVVKTALIAGTMLGLLIIARFYWSKVRKEFIKLVLMGIVTMVYMESLVLRGVYAENISMLFLVWTVVFVLTKKSFLWGLFLSLTIMGRQTFVMFVPFVVYLVVRQKGINLLELKKTFLGFCLPLFLIGGWLLVTGDLMNYVNNTVVFNLNYAKAVAVYKGESLLFGVWDGGIYSLLIMLIIISGVVLWKLKKNRFEGLGLVILFGCSLLTTFSGGIFYPHHFYQFYLLIFLVLGELVFESSDWFSISKGIILLIILSFGLLKFWENVDYGQGSKFLTFENKKQLLTEIESKKYMIVVTFYPRLYFDFQKSAPDRYYQPFFLSSFLNKEFMKEVNLHREFVADKASETAFVIVKKNFLDKIVADDYLRNFGSDFKLVKVNSYRIEDFDIEVYWAK